MSIDTLVMIDKSNLFDHGYYTHLPAVKLTTRQWEACLGVGSSSDSYLPSNKLVDPANSKARSNRARGLLDRRRVLSKLPDMFTFEALQAELEFIKKTKSPYPAYYLIEQALLDRWITWLTPSRAKNVSKFQKTQLFLDLKTEKQTLAFIDTN